MSPEVCQLNFMSDLFLFLFFVPRSIQNTQHSAVSRGQLPLQGSTPVAYRALHGWPMLVLSLVLLPTACHGMRDFQCLVHYIPQNPSMFAFCFLFG